MKISINFETDLLVHEFENVKGSYGAPSIIEFSGSVYELNVLLEIDKSKFNIEIYSDKDNSIIDKEYCLKKCLDLVDLLNRLMRQIRTFVTDNSNYKLLSPENIKEFLVKDYVSKSEYVFTYVKEVQNISIFSSIVSMMKYISTHGKE